MRRRKRKHKPSTWLDRGGIIHYIDEWGLACRQDIPFRRPVANSLEDRVVTCLGCAAASDEPADDDGD